MKDEKKFIELNAEEAEKVVGGYDDEDGNWVPPTCSILQRWYSMPESGKRKFLLTQCGYCEDLHGSVAECINSMDDCPFHQAWKNRNYL